MSDLEPVRTLLREARAVVVLTGAGVSAESGVPTFRGPGGLWRSFKPEDLATPEAFARDPRLVWEWYDWRRGLVAAAQPNLGHYALVTLEKRAPEFTLITQNVDGLHARAGSRRSLEVHGSLWRTRCVECREIRDDRRVPLPALPPRCACEGLLRPDIVWFGEALPLDVLREVRKAIESCDLMLVVGTSGLVQPAASFGDSALARGVPMIEVNPDPTPLSAGCAHVLRGLAGDILPKLL
jgi:NAD-dependent deacetylase